MGSIAHAGPPKGKFALRGPVKANCDPPERGPTLRPCGVSYGKLRPYLNKVIVADQPGYCTTEIVPIRAFGYIDSAYLCYALKCPNFIDYANTKSYGMNLPRLGTEDARRAPFPLPPLAEQRRIVAKVDELMALVDQLEAQLATARTRASQLLDAMIAELTAS